MERKFTIEFNWWSNEVDEINTMHSEALKEAAWERITEMRKEGYTSGELNDTIRMHDSDGEEGISYRGWWEIKEEK